MHACVHARVFLLQGASDQSGVVLRPLVPRDSPLGAAAGAAGALDDPLAAFGAGRDMPTELTDGRGGYTASYDAQPPKRWAFLACEALHGDAVAFTTSVYLVDEEDGQRYLLGTMPPTRVGTVRWVSQRLQLLLCARCTWW